MRWCLEWQQTGLAPPADRARRDQDHLQQWLDDCTQDAGLFAFTRIRDLFSSWKKWCEERNLKPGSASALSEALTQDAGLFAFTRIRDLFSSWKKWCEERNLKPGSASALSEALADRGFVKKREAGTGQRGFAHLTVKAS
jgi:hypothetical protein